MALFFFNIRFQISEESYYFMKNVLHGFVNKGGISATLSTPGDVIVYLGYIIGDFARLLYSRFYVNKAKTK